MHSHIKIRRISRHEWATVGRWEVEKVGYVGLFGNLVYIATINVIWII